MTLKRITLSRMTFARIILNKMTLSKMTPNIQQKDTLISTEFNRMTLYKMIFDILT
jgi:hypothetical protein